MTISLAKWKLEDYHHMVEMGLLDDRPVELLNGEIVEMSSEGEPHAYFSTEEPRLSHPFIGRSRYNPLNPSHCPTTPNPNRTLPLSKGWDENISATIPILIMFFG